MEKNLVLEMILTVAKDQCLTPMTQVHQERAQNMMETTPMHPEKAQTMILTIQMLVFPCLVLTLMIQLVARDPQNMILTTPIHPGKVQHMILIIQMLVTIPVIEKDLQSMTLMNLNQLQERGLDLIPMTLMVAKFQDMILMIPIQPPGKAQILILIVKTHMVLTPMTQVDPEKAPYLTPTILTHQVYCLVDPEKVPYLTPTI